MDNKINKSKGFSRRRFIGSTAAVAAFSMVPLKSALGKSPASSFQLTDSNFNGVNIGAITYSWRSMPGGVDNIIKYCTETGISTIELMSGDVEEYLGAPENPMMSFFRNAPPPPPPPPPAPATDVQPKTPQPAAPPPPPPRRFELTPEQKAAMEKYNQDVKAWRLALPISKYADVKKKFDDAGISVHIIKFSPSKWSDEEIDYAFKAAKAIGAKGVTEEIGEEAVKKLAPFAEKHGLYAIFHNHMQFATPGFSVDPFLAVSPSVMLNFDSGHYFGSTGKHPNEFIEKYHDRIVSLHIKDKTGPNVDPANTNQVWGQGQMPLAEVLTFVQKQKYPIFCDIELEYDVKPWSDAVKEVKNCVNFAKAVLM
ncbi:MAG TPA: sugar phosphate isomerase/epimerase [Bacteroidales bacterium]|nr:sugar phosphate isomerase/epimerase [Bacteroidales bacterium]